MNDVLRSGTNFGDILGGKKSYEDAEKEIQANRQLEESKRKLIDATKSAAGKLGGLALSAAGLVKTLHLVNAGTLARQMSLAELSPGHAFAAGKTEAHRIRLDIERGRATSGSFARLSDRQNEMERALAPAKNTFTNVSNNLLAHLTSWATQIIRGVNIIAEETGRYAEIGAKGGGIVGGGLIGGPIGAIVGKRLADKGIEAAKGLGNGTPSGPQPEHWSKLFDDIANGKLTSPKMPRRF